MKSIRLVRSLALTILAIVIASASAWAQATATVSGTVRDQSGAVLPGVTITVTQQETGATRTTVSNETGSYVLPNLPLGPYRLEAVLQQNSPALLVLDLRCHETHDLLEQVKAEWPDVLIVALGVPRSEPLRDAEQAGIYAAEDVDLDQTVDVLFKRIHA